MTTRCLRRVASLFLLCFPSFCSAQLVTIRVIDTADGHPLQKQQISVSFLYGSNEPKPTHYDATLHLATDRQGEAHLKLPEPPPPHLSAQVHLTSEQWRCGCGVLATTQDVIQKGIVGPSPGSESKKSVVAERAAPGEILILARPLTFFERLLYPLVKE